MAQVEARSDEPLDADSRHPSGVRWASLAIALGLTFFGGLGFLLDLHAQYLWQDEAQTALIAETVLERGLPYGTDGRNFFSQELGAEYGPDYLWRWHTWLPFYVVAGSFELIGVTTFAARLPFALFGFATVVLLYFYVLEAARSRPAAIAAAILLLGNVPFLILSRQCRYYSAAAFFSLLGLFAYRRLLEGRRHSAILFVAAGLLLFHTHYVYTATLLAAVALHCLLLYKQRVKTVALACSATVLLCIPWIVWLSEMQYGERYSGMIQNLSPVFVKGVAFVHQIIDYIFPPYLLIVPLVVWGASRFSDQVPSEDGRSSARAMTAPLIFIVVNLVVLAIVTPHEFFRYLAPLIAPALAVAGVICAAAYRLHPAAGVAALLPALALQPLSDFAYELTHDYDGPIEGIIEHLQAHADPDDVVAITYGDLPLKFYTDLRVLGGLTGEDLEPAIDARWVISRHNVISGKDYAVKLYLNQNVDVRRYRLIEIDYPDIMFENRESPTGHHYRTVIDAPRVRIAERVRR